MSTEEMSARSKASQKRSSGVDPPQSDGKSSVPSGKRLKMRPPMRDAMAPPDEHQPRKKRTSKKSLQQLLDERAREREEYLEKTLRVSTDEAADLERFLQALSKVPRFQGNPAHARSCQAPQPAQPASRRAPCTAPPRAPQGTAPPYLEPCAPRAAPPPLAPPSPEPCTPIVPDVCLPGAREACVVLSGMKSSVCSQQKMIHTLGNTHVWKSAIDHITARRVQPIVICGPVGCGKTCGIADVAAVLEHEVFTCSVSDLSDAATLSEWLRGVCTYSGLLGRTMCVVEDVEGLDACHMNVIAKYIAGRGKSDSPLLFTCVDAYHPHARRLQNHCVTLKMHAPAREIVDAYNRRVAGRQIPRDLRDLRQVRLRSEWPALRFAHVDRDDDIFTCAKTVKLQRGTFEQCGHDHLLCERLVYSSIPKFCATIESASSFLDCLCLERQDTCVYESGLRLFAAGTSMTLTPYPKPRKGTLYRSYVSVNGPSSLG